MANIKYSDLLTEVLPNLAADPSDPVTENAIKRAVIEFCAETWIWKDLSEAIDVEAGEAYYDLEPPNGADIVVVMDAAYNGVPIEPKSLSWLDANIPGWRTTPGTPKYFTHVDLDQVILAPVPADNLTGGLTVTLALQPSHNATGLPKWIATQHMYSMADGALARLMLMPSKPWTDLANGSDRRAQFQAAIANARANAASALGRAATRTASQH